MRKKIGELLVEAGATVSDEIKNALGNQKTWGAGQKLGQVLVSMGKVTQLQVAQALSRQFDLPFIELPQIPANVSSLLPVDFQSEHRIVPFRLELEGKLERLHVAVADPAMMDLIDEIRFQLGKPVRVFIAAVDDIEEVLAALRGDSVAELDPIDIDEDSGEEMVVERAADQVPAGWFGDAAPGAPSPVAAAAAAPPALAADLPPEWDLGDASPNAALDDLLGTSAPVAKAVPVVKFDAPPKTPPKGVPAASGAALAPAALPAPENVPAGSTMLAAPPSNLVAAEAAPVAALAADPIPVPAAPPPSLTQVPALAAVPAEPAPVPPITASSPTPAGGMPLARIALVKTAVAAEKPFEFSDDDLKILENIELMANGNEPNVESAKVKPAQMVASLVRLLMKKGVIGETEFLEELGRK